MRQNRILAFCAMLALSAIISACGSVTNAQNGRLDELPTPPPAPTYAAEPDAALPPAPEAGLPKGNQASLAVDTFDGNLAAWQVLDLRVLPGATPSAWEIKNGQLLQVNGPDGMLSQTPTALLTGDAGWSDYSVKAAAYSYGNSNMGLTGRASEKGLYALVIRAAGSKGGKEITLQRYDAASETFTLLATAETGGWNKANWYALELSFKGDTITASINGADVLTAKDATYASGKAGVYGYAEGELAFDNFSVQPN